MTGATVVTVLLAGCSVGAPAAAALAHATASSTAASPSAALPAPTQIGASPAATAAPLATSEAEKSDAGCVGTASGIKTIYVSISTQHLWACTGSVLVVDGPVTTGASALTNVHNATPTGTMHITKKVRNTVLAGSDVNGPWNDPVSYWMPFTGGIGFHDSSWQTFPLGSPLYTTQGSHGCIHVALSTIATIFDWASVGTLVVIRA